MLMPTAIAQTPVLPTAGFVLAALSLRELLVGTIWALALALPFLAVEWGGRIADQLRGAMPSGRGPSPLGELHLWVAVVAFVALGGHHLVVAALADGLVSHPLGLNSRGSW